MCSYDDGFKPPADILEAAKKWYTINSLVVVTFSIARALPCCGNGGGSDKALMWSHTPPNPCFPIMSFFLKEYTLTLYERNMLLQGTRVYGEEKDKGQWPRVDRGLGSDQVDSSGGRHEVSLEGAKNIREGGEKRERERDTV